MNILGETVKWILEKGFRAKKVPNDILQERIAICEGCDQFREETRQCKICWCFMDAKAALVIDPMKTMTEGHEVLAVCAANPPKWQAYIE